MYKNNEIVFLFFCVSLTKQTLTNVSITKRLAHFRHKV